jgi:hypothetical protein
VGGKGNNQAVTPVSAGKLTSQAVSGSDRMFRESWVFLKETVLAFIEDEALPRGAAKPMELAQRTERNRRCRLNSIRVIRRMDTPVVRVTRFH